MNILLIFPFIIFLLLISTCPIFYPKLWTKHYKIISLIFAFIIIIIYLVQGFYFNIIESLSQYISFITLLGSLYIIAGGISLRMNMKATPLINSLFLFIGAIISNIIGTTGASLLLIFPFIHLNKLNIRPYHIIFFIFIISNTGGLLTPMGDPPLFLGYLKNIPFFWNISHLLLPWLLAVFLLCFIFFLIDKKNQPRNIKESYYLIKNITITGKRNFIGIIIILITIFIDPRLFKFIPVISFNGYDFSFIREIIQILIALSFYYYANKTAHQLNKFTFTALNEIIFLFFAIFFTMMPVLELIKHLAGQPRLGDQLTPTTLYWMTGFLSTILDNAPTYINMLTASMAKYGLDINIPVHISNFISYNPIYKHFQGNINLMCISLASVIFGAFTYIGNMGREFHY